MIKLCLTATLSASVKGLEILRRGLSPYSQEFKAKWGGRWWQVVSETSLPGSIGLRAEGQDADEGLCHPGCTGLAGLDVAQLEQKCFRPNWDTPAAVM